MKSASQVSYWDGDTDTEFVDQNRWCQADTVASSKESPDQSTVTFLTHGKVHVQRTCLHDWTSFRSDPQRSEGMCAYPIGQDVTKTSLSPLDTQQRPRECKRHTSMRRNRTTNREESTAQFKSWVTLIQDVWLNYSTQRSAVEPIRSACRTHKWPWKRRGRMDNGKSRLWPESRTEPPTQCSS